MVFILPLNSVNTVPSGGTFSPNQVMKADTSGRLVGSGYLFEVNGSVGIGTALPFGRFTVVGGATQISPGTAAQEGVRIQQASGVCSFSGINYDNNAYNALSFSTGASESMRIDTSGKVGIGTNNPGSTLHVDGDVRVRSINGGPLAGFRNRIINGDMRIDQRNNGASVSIAADNTSYFPADRCLIRKAGTQTITAQRSTVAPTGFNNSALVTVSSGAAITSGTYFIIGQNIEGFNIADFGWGTPDAQTVTISFWARSSATGTFNTLFSNNDDNRSYLANFTISSANTWEYKTVTVLGDTGGTWTTDSTAGLKFAICLGGGTTFQTAPGSWASGTFLVSSTATNTFLTAANTFHLTGVQLEVSSVATPFERRPIGTELALCQRYYCETRASARFPAFGAGQIMENHILWPVNMRVAPTITVTSGGIRSNNLSGYPQTQNSTIYGARYLLASNGAGDCYAVNDTITAAIEL